MMRAPSSDPVSSRSGAPAHPAAFEVRGLRFSYEDGDEVLKGVDLALGSGEVFVILGANGSGKTTLLNCMCNMLSPSAGEVLLDGRPIADYPIVELARIVGYVPQVSTPVFDYTVRDYVVMGRAPYMNLLSVPKEEEYLVADEVLERMRISHLAGKSYGNISGGERQQAQIARVLAQKSRIIFLDEPTNHLDYGNQLKIIDIIAELAYEDGLSIVLTSHNPDHAIVLDGKAGILGRDGVLYSGPAIDVVTEESLRVLYDVDLRLVRVSELDRFCCVAGRRRRKRAS